MKIIRYIIIVALSLFTFWAVASESETITFLDFLLLKSVGIIVGYITYRLIMRWYKNGYLPEMERIMEDDDE